MTSFTYRCVVMVLTGYACEIHTRLVEARAEAMAVAPRVFEYRNDLLADSLLEAAYRVAAGRGVGAAVGQAAFEALCLEGE